MKYRGRVAVSVSAASVGGVVVLSLVAVPAVHPVRVKLRTRAHGLHPVQPSAPLDFVSTEV